VLVGDGSYLIMNSEIATSIAMGQKLLIVLLDNRGFGCINRLQQATVGERFNNLLPSVPQIDFAAHAQALGAISEKARNVGELEVALTRALAADRTSVIVIETDPEQSTDAGGAWWDVPVAEVSERPAVKDARKAYDEQVGRVRR
jgi:3D-(3,5/4)-trihydroxycyclohexane-1,2-dione acylhydrolase (decyclizing)